MGNSQSVQMVHTRIDAKLPHHTYELASSPKEQQSLLEKLAPTFPGGPQDRAQFVHSLRVLLSSNGALPLGDKRFRLVFSRAPEEFSTEDEPPQYYASMVAVSSDGVLAAKVVSERPGTTKLEAFQSFRKTVEMHMHKMLDTVPGPSAGAASSSSFAPYANPEASISQNTIASTILPDEPPSYQEASK